MAQPSWILRNGFENVSKDSWYSQSKCYEDNFKVKKCFVREFGKKEDELMIILQNLREQQSDLEQMNR